MAWVIGATRGKWSASGHRFRSELQHSKCTGCGVLSAEIVTKGEPHDYAVNSRAVAGSAMKTSRSLTSSRSQPYSFDSKGLPLATPFFQTIHNVSGRLAFLRLTFLYKVR